jgi:hypothetical protein
MGADMKSVADFDYVETRDVLISMLKRLPEDSQEKHVLQLVGRLLLYVYYDRKRLEAFREWCEEGALPAAQEEFNASHVFATQEEADAWRGSGKATDGERVIIAGQGYEVVDVPPYGLKFRWLPLPSQLAAWAAEEDEDAPAS